MKELSGKEMDWLKDIEQNLENHAEKYRKEAEERLKKGRHGLEDELERLEEYVKGVRKGEICENTTQESLEIAKINVLRKLLGKKGSLGYNYEFIRAHKKLCNRKDCWFKNQVCMGKSPESVACLGIQFICNKCGGQADMAKQPIKCIKCGSTDVKTVTIANPFMK